MACCHCLVDGCEGTDHLGRCPCPKDGESAELYIDTPPEFLMLSQLWLCGRDQADVLTMLLRQNGAICREGILYWAAVSVR